MASAAAGAGNGHGNGDTFVNTAGAFTGLAPEAGQTLSAVSYGQRRLQRGLPGLDCQCAAQQRERLGVPTGQAPRRGPHEHHRGQMGGQSIPRGGGLTRQALALQQGASGRSLESAPSIGGYSRSP